MNRFKLIVVGIVALIIAGAICTASGSSLMNNTSHAITSQANLEGIRTMRFMAGTIDRQATMNTIALGIVAVVLLVMALIVGALVVRFILVGGGRSGSSRAGWMPERGRMPKFISLGSDVRPYLDRLNPEQKTLLLERLYTICSYLERDLGNRRMGRGREQRMTVYERDDDSNSAIFWG
jgi:hypothetical protein